MTDVDKAVDALLHALTNVAGEVEATLPTRQFFIDWHELFNADHGDEQWLAWPVVPAYRQIVLYAPAKTGKSLITLDIAASMASGRPILGQENPHGRQHVVYLDYEMTEADLLERLGEMGYEPEDLEGYLHYALLPALPPLNTPEGAKAIRELAQGVDAVLVIVDTLARAVDGDENDAGTVNDFFRWTGTALKADKRALLRVDHAGKDISKGQRGSSAKEGDVDIVWQLTKTDDGLKLKRTHTRILWGENEVNVTVHREPLRHTIAPRGWAAGTGDVVAALDRLGLPDNASMRTCGAALREKGESASSAALKDACRRRRERGGLDALINQHQEPRSTTFQRGAADSAEHHAEHQPKNAVTRAEHHAEHHGAADLAGAPQPPLPSSGAAEQPGFLGPDEPIEDLISGFFRDED